MILVEATSCAPWPCKNGTPCQGRYIRAWSRMTPKCWYISKAQKMSCNRITTKCKIFTNFGENVWNSWLEEKNCKTLPGQGCCLEDDLPLLSAIVACFRQNGNFFRPQPLSHQLMINSVWRRNRSSGGRSRQLVPFSTAATGLVAVVERRDM